MNSTGKVPVTVLMPVYNGGPFLKDAIESILAQTFTEFEFLIVDDGSKDTSLEVIRGFSDARIKLIQNEKNLGLIATLNKGLSLAQGEFVARMDQDDLAVPERLAKQVALLRGNPEILGTGSALTLINMKGETVGNIAVLTEFEQIRRALAVTNPFAHPTMMVRREIVKKLGGYRSEAYATEDYDLWTRLVKEGPVVNIEEPLLRYRLTTTGMSISLSTSQKQGAAVIANRVWGDFSEEGPAPVSDWGLIWPENGRTTMSVEKLLMFSNLHLLFAKGYRKRGQWNLAIRHLVASFAWSSGNRASFFAVCMFLLPYSWYLRLEEWLMKVLDHSRAGKLA